MHVMFHMTSVLLKANHKLRKTNFIFIYVVLQNTSLLLQLWLKGEGRGEEKWLFWFYLIKVEILEHNLEQVMNCTANASTANDWIHSILPVSEVTSTPTVQNCSFPLFPSNSHIGKKKKKKIFSSLALKPYVNIFGKLVENLLSPLGYGKAHSFTVVISIFGTPEPRNSCLALSMHGSVSASFVSVFTGQLRTNLYFCDWRKKGQQKWKTKIIICIFSFYCIFHYIVYFISFSGIFIFSF